jgi:hypothetical protein
LTAQGGSDNLPGAMHLVLRRSAVVLLAVALGWGFAAATAGCAGPYSGQSEKLKRPKEKRRPKPKEGEEPALVMSDKCRTNFFEKPTTRRNERLGLTLSKQAETTIVEADAQTGEARLLLVQEALSKLRNALKADPYGPEPTYKMAVAYALAGKKGCSLALLERLQLLSRMPEVQTEAERTIGRAQRDQAFDAFRKDADAALGR